MGGSLGGGDFGSVAPVRDSSHLAQQEVWECHRAKMLSLDRYAWIDILLLDVISGPGAEKELQKQFMNLMPAEGIIRDLGDSFRKAKEMMDSELFVYANAATKGTLQAAVKILEQMHAKVTPKPPNKATQFLLDTWSRVPYFAKVELVEHSDVEGVAPKKTLLMGKAAVVHLWGQLVKKPRKEISLDELDRIGVFSWLLEEKQRSELHALSMQVMEGHSRKAKTQKKRKEPEAVTKKSENDIASARAFLGLE